MNLKKLLGARIKELRKASHLSQERLSEMIGKDAKHISRIEVGGSYPSLDTLEKIAHALDSEMKDFFEFSHLADFKTINNDIVKMIRKADEEKRKLIARLIKAVIR